jgi:membrane-bound ClpP family serine protease
MQPDDQQEDEGAGAAGLIGVVFVIALVIGAIVLIERVKTSSAQTDCILTHDPRCRALTDK